MLFFDRNESATGYIGPKTAAKTGLFCPVMSEDIISLTRIDRFPILAIDKNERNES